MPGMNALLGGGDLTLQRHELRRHPCKAGSSKARQPFVVRIGDHREELSDLWQADPRDDAKLGHMGADPMDYGDKLAAASGPFLLRRGGPILLCR